MNLALFCGQLITNNLVVKGEGEIVLGDRGIE